MEWEVIFHEAFEGEFEALPEAVQDELLANAKLLETLGPHLKRLRADTLNGSKHAKMKELRFEADDGVWRVAFAFDPERKGILLVAGDKSGQPRAAGARLGRVIRVRGEHSLVVGESKGMVLERLVGGGAAHQRLRIVFGERERRRAVGDYEVVFAERRAARGAVVEALDLLFMTSWEQIDGA